ncbi:MAG: biotin--[acetyl-CoA-carboxylase] ligase [Candidatus Omnitrophica bacterium]|nr:biotin--[acetyl-CoA-carboxylase] ligase [Candidatus Omnitrophota bacterium]
MIIGPEIKHYKEVSSTNDTARELAQKGAEEGTVVSADFQTRGRGRQGRTWSCPAKEGILLSVILRPDMLLEQSMLITLLSSLAIVRAVENVYSITPAIKWPNDIYINNKKIVSDDNFNHAIFSSLGNSDTFLDCRKLCGILTESVSQGDRIDYVIIGLGFNVNSDIEDLPKGSISIKEIIGKISLRQEIQNEILTQLDYYYNIFTQRQTEQIIKEYRQNCLLLGQQVKAVFKGKNIQGQALDINEQGALILRLDTGLEIELHSSEVEIIR